MPGGLAQLASYGTADVVLTGDPQVTYFKQIFRRHTNFSVESIENAFAGPVDFGKKSTCQISRNGDLVCKIWLQVTLPDIGAYDVFPAPSEGQTVDASTRLFYKAADKGYYKEAGFTHQVAFYSPTTYKYYTSDAYTTEIVTWPFMLAGDTNYNSSTEWTVPTQRVRWCNGIGYALVKEAEIEIGGNKIDKHFSDFWDIWSELTEKEEKRQGLWDMVGKYDASDFASYSRGHAEQRTFYVPLTFCFQKSPGLAIPLVSLQYHNININLEFRNYMELIKTNSDIHSTPTTITSFLSKSGSLPPSFVDCKLYSDFIYLDAEERRRFASIPHEYLIETLQCLGDQPVDTGTNNQKIQLTFSHPVKELIWTYTPLANYTVSPQTGNNIFDYSIPGSPTVDPVDSVRLLINGGDRFSQRPGKYFRLVQAYQHHTRVPSKFIYSYSFALNPEDLQPSGSINYSRVDTSQLQLNFNSLLAQGHIRVFAVSYNVCRIASGQAGLAFAS